MRLSGCWGSLRGAIVSSSGVRTRLNVGTDRYQSRLSKSDWKLSAGTLTGKPYHPLSHQAGQKRVLGTEPRYRCDSCCESPSHQEPPVDARSVVLVQDRGRITRRLVSSEFKSKCARSLRRTLRLPTNRIPKVVWARFPYTRWYRRAVSVLVCSRSRVQHNL